MSEPKENTDIVIWREVSDRFVHSSIHVTENRGIGIDVGGHVFVKPIEEWHELALGELNRRAPSAERHTLEGDRHPESYCHKCGGPNIVWFVANPLWNKYMPDDGIICPVCFVQIAESCGLECIAWELVHRTQAQIEQPQGEPVTEGLKPVDPALLQPFKDAMQNETIPGIVDAVRQRQRNAAEDRGVLYTHQQPQVQDATTTGNAPLGTRAPAIGGGYWVKVERGWKWHTGSVFPRPGGDWDGRLILPERPQVQGEPVAVVGDTYSLFWIGMGPIAPLIARHNIKPGDNLYTQPRAAVPDEIVRLAIAAVHNWNEFGAGHGLDEWMDALEKALAAAPAQPGEGG